MSGSVHINLVVKLETIPAPEFQSKKWISNDKNKQSHFSICRSSGWQLLFLPIRVLQPYQMREEVQRSKRLDSCLIYGRGQTELLIQAREEIVRALKVNSQDYLALKELARCQMAEGYINSRNVAE